MQKKTFFAWREGLVINLVSNAIAFLVGCVVAYLKHDGSEWVSPLLFGALAWFLTMGLWVVIRLFRNIPTRQVKITDSNLQATLRNWLDDIGLKVQSAKDEHAEFMFIVTTDGGKVISIIRHKEISHEYLTFSGYFKDETQTKTFSHFTNEEKTAARLTIQLELARAVMA
jgi:hypothetical protein